MREEKRDIYRKFGGIYLSNDMLWPHGKAFDYDHISYNLVTDRFVS
jgi:hypothetical protein